MIYPSPDWFVGVSGLELCLGNGSWIEQKILNLYPYDAGTDSGPTYISPDQPTIPKEPIRRIKANHPNDPRSPFHDPDNKEMKPLARLYLSRQRLYEKNCDAIIAQDTQNDCAVGKWTDWSKCDNPCGKGRRSRQRYYLKIQLAYQKGCKKKLTDHEECHGTRENCDDEPIDQDFNLRPNFDPECALTEWSAYGECSNECGKGQRSRTRRFRIRKNHKKCLKNNPVELEQFLTCEGKSCVGVKSGDEKTLTKKKVREFLINFYVHLRRKFVSISMKKVNRACKLSDWSRWSPCTVSCGLGERMRVRVPIEKHSTASEHQEKIMKLYKKFNAQHNKNFNEIADEEEDNETDESREEDLSDLEILGILKMDHPCANEIFVEKQTCGMRNKPCEYEIFGIPRKTEALCS
jgi:spondin-1